MIPLNAAIYDNFKTVLPPAYQKNVSQMNGKVPVINGMNDIPVGQNVGSYLGQKQSEMLRTNHADILKKLYLRR